MKWCLHLNMPIRNMMLKILKIYYGQYRNYHYLSMNFDRYSTLVLLLATLPADRWPLNTHPTHPYHTHYNKSDRLPIQCKLATLPANRWPLNVHPTHPYCTHYNKSDRLPIQCKLATLPAHHWPLNAHPTHPYHTHYNKSDRLPIQCKQCDIRFADDSAEKLDMQNHLDMHFRQNHKANQNMGCGHSCNWFVTLEVHNIFNLAYCFH